MTTGQYKEERVQNKIKVMFRCLDFYYGKTSIRTFQKLFNNRIEVSSKTLSLNQKPFGNILWVESPKRWRFHFQFLLFSVAVRRMAGWHQLLIQPVCLQRYKYIWCKHTTSIKTKRRNIQNSKTLKCLQTMFLGRVAELRMSGSIYFKE